MAAPMVTENRTLSIESIPGSDRLQCRVHDLSALQTVGEFVITHDNAWMLLSNLASILRSQSEQRVRSVAAGNCPRCHNVRLVNERKGARDELVHCPECRARYDGATVNMVDGSRKA